jgi:hypothetical protein
VLKVSETAAHLRLPFAQADIHATGRQQRSGGQSADATSDDDYFVLHQNVWMMIA